MILFVLLIPTVCPIPGTKKAVVNNHRKVPVLMELPLFWGGDRNLKRKENCVDEKEEGEEKDGKRRKKEFEGRKGGHEEKEDSSK